MSDESLPGVEVPWTRIEEATLDRLIEDFVTRQQSEDFDDLPLSARVAQVRVALQQRRAAVVFDAVTESFSLVTREPGPR